MSMNNNKAFSPIDSVQIDEHLSEVHTCSYCKIKFINVEDLKLHSQLHDKNKHFTGLLCKEVFSEFQQLKLHDLRHSLEEANEKSIDLEHLDLPFGLSRCHICGKNFSCDEELFNHCVTHKENMEKINPRFDQRTGDDNINSDSSESSIKDKEINYRILRQEMIRAKSGNIYIRLTLIDHKNESVEEFTRMIHKKIKTKKSVSSFHVKKNKADFRIAEKKSEFRLKMKNPAFHVKEKDIHMNEKKSKFHVKMTRPRHHVKEKIPVFRAKEMKPKFCININKPIFQAESNKSEIFDNLENPILQTESKKPKIFVKEKKSMLESKIMKQEFHAKKRKSEYYDSEKPIKQKKTNVTFDSEIFINDIQNGEVNSEKNIESKLTDDEKSTAVKPDEMTGPLKHSRRSKLLALKKKIWKPSQTNMSLKKISNVCPTCHKSFISRDQFVRHLSVHKKLVRYDCSKCSKQFQSKTLVHQHMAMYHGGKGQYLKGGTVCTVCDRVFKFRIHFTNHKCSLESVIKCSICNYKFSRNFHLRRHLMNVHKLERDDADSLINSARLESGNMSSPASANLIKTGSRDVTRKLPKSNDSAPQKFENESESFSKSKSQEKKVKDKNSKKKLLKVQKPHKNFATFESQNKIECKRVSEIKSQDIVNEGIKTNSISEDNAIDSGSGDIEINFASEAIKTESVLEDIKTKIVSENIETNLTSEAIKTELVSENTEIESISEDKINSISESVEDISYKSAESKLQLIKKRSKVLIETPSRIINRNLNLTLNRKHITRGKRDDVLMKKKLNSSISKNKNAKVLNFKSKSKSIFQKKSKAKTETQKKSTSNTRNKSTSKKSASNTPKKSTSHTPKKSTSHTPKKSTNNTPKKSTSNTPKKSTSSIKKKSTSSIQKKSASKIQKKSVSDIQKESKPQSKYKKVVKKPVLRKSSSSVTNKKSENKTVTKSSANNKSKKLPMPNIEAKTPMKLRGESITVLYQSKGSAKKTALKSLNKQVAKKGTLLKNSISSKKTANIKNSSFTEKARMKKRVQPKKLR